MTEAEIAILSALLGAMSGGLIEAFRRSRETFRERKAMALALRAEVRTLLGLVELRQYPQLLERIMGRLRDANHPVVDDDIFAVRIQENYFSVFEGCAAKLGLLPSCAAELVVTYGLARSFLEDVAVLWVFREKVLDGRIQINNNHREWLATWTQAVANILTLCINNGRGLEQKLTKIAEGRWLLNSS